LYWYNSYSIDYKASEKFIDKFAKVIVDENLIPPFLCVLAIMINWLLCHALSA
jgi:hypothetical protein